MQTLRVCLLFALGVRAVSAQTPGTAWDSVARILQTPGAFSGGYHRYNFPRRDITLRIGDVTVSPALALGGWAGFSGEPGAATVMGDLVLLAGEVKSARRGPRAARWRRSDSCWFRAS